MMGGNFRRISQKFYFVSFLSISLFMLFFSPVADGQKIKSLNEILQDGLKNNFDIQIVRNVSQISKNNNSFGNAGYFPTLEADGTGTESNQHINQQYSNGSDIQKTGVKTTNLTAGIELDWTVFNGFLMFAAKHNLNALDKIGMLNFRNQVEISSAAIISAYYNIVRQQEQVKVLKESIKISSIKLDIAKTKFDIGSASKLDYLQAEVDLNADSANYINQVASVKKAKKVLNYLIGEKDTSNYLVADSIILAPAISFNGLQSLALQQNEVILAADARREAALAQIDMAKSGQYPSLTLSSRYNFSDNQAQAGFILLNQANGLNYFGTVRWNLIEGGTVKLGIKNAHINEDIANLTYQDSIASINKQISTNYEDYLANINLVNLVKDNMKFAVENLDIATESYRIGKISLVDFRTAQLGYVNAVTSLENAIYSAKNSEITLMRLTGQIKKEVQ